MPQFPMNDFWTIFAAVTSALILAGGAYSCGRDAGYKQARRDLNNEREAKRFSEIYAPLMGLFTACYITTSPKWRAPYFRQRLGNALRFLRIGRLVQAMLAIFDKQDRGVSGEVEYGSSFPLSEITKHLGGREQFADQRLICLVTDANRARYEEQPEDNELTSADLALTDHVNQQYKALSRRFVGT